MNWQQFDDERLEWEFERLREEHAQCCPGAVLLKGMWVNVLHPVLNEDGTLEPSYRPFESA